MAAILVSLAVLILSWVSLYAGSWLAKRAPQEHLESQALQSAQFGIGMMTTLAALVIGFMVTSARQTFDRAQEDIVAVSTSIVLLDRALSGYGSDAQPMQQQLRDFLALATARVSADGEMESIVFRSPRVNLSFLTRMQQSLLSLKPSNASQQWFQARALAISTQLGQERVLTSEHEQSSVPTTLVVVVIVWIMLIFVGLGAFAMHNRSVMIVLLCCALAFSGSIFLILELETPYTGVVRVSGQPLIQAASEFDSH
jgi:hypothetical protein